VFRENAVECHPHHDFIDLAVPLLCDMPMVAGRIRPASLLVDTLDDRDIRASHHGCTRRRPVQLDSACSCSIPSACRSDTALFLGAAVKVDAPASDSICEPYSLVGD